MFVLCSTNTSDLRHVLVPDTLLTLVVNYKQSTSIFQIYHHFLGVSVISGVRICVGAS